MSALELRFLAGVLVGMGAGFLLGVWCLVSDARRRAHRALRRPPFTTPEDGR